MKPSLDPIPVTRPLMECGFDSLDLHALARNAVGALRRTAESGVLLQPQHGRSDRRLFSVSLASRSRQRPVAASPATGKEDVAIVGMACRLPGGVVSTGQFWRLLHDGVDAITEVPLERWDIDAFYDADPDAPGKMYTRWGGFLEGRRSVRPQFFGMAPREALTPRSAAAPAARGQLGSPRARRAAARRAARAARPACSSASVGNEYVAAATARPDAVGSRRVCRHRQRTEHGRRPPVLHAWAFRDRASPSTPPARRRSSRCTWRVRACGSASADLALAGGVNLTALARPPTSCSRGRG